MKTKLYELKVYLTVECQAEHQKQIEEDMLDALVAVADKYDASIGGGLALKELTGIEIEDDSENKEVV